MWPPIGPSAENAPNVGRLRSYVCADAQHTSASSGRLLGERSGRREWPQSSISGDGSSCGSWTLYVLRHVIRTSSLHPGRVGLDNNHAAWQPPTLQTRRPTNLLARPLDETSSAKKTSGSHAIAYGEKRRPERRRQHQHARQPQRASACQYYSPILKCTRARTTCYSAPQGSGKARTHNIERRALCVPQGLSTEPARLLRSAAKLAERPPKTRGARSLPTPQSAKRPSSTKAARSAEVVGATHRRPSSGEAPAARASRELNPSAASFLVVLLSAATTESEPRKICRAKRIGGSGPHQSMESTC